MTKKEFNRLKKFVSLRENMYEVEILEIYIRFYNYKYNKYIYQEGAQDIELTTKKECKAFLEAPEMIIQPKHIKKIQCVIIVNRRFHNYTERQYHFFNNRKGL